MEGNGIEDEELLMKKEEIKKHLDAKFTRQKKSNSRQLQGKSSRNRNYNEGYGSNQEPSQAAANEQHYNDNGSKNWHKTKPDDAVWERQELKTNLNRRDDSEWDEHQEARGRSGRRDRYQGRNPSNRGRGAHWRQRKNSTESNEREESVTSERGGKPKKKYYNHDDRFYNPEDPQKGRRDRGNWGTWKEENRGGYRREEQGRRDYNRHYSGGWNNKTEQAERGYAGKDGFNTKTYINRDNRREQHQEKGGERQQQPKRSNDEQGAKSRATPQRTAGPSPQPAGVWNDRSGAMLFKKPDPLGDLLPRTTDEEEVMLKKALEESKKSAREEEQIRSLYPAQEGMSQPKTTMETKVGKLEKTEKEDYTNVLGTKVWEETIKPAHGQQMSKYNYAENQSKEASYFSTNEDNGWGDTKWSYNSNVWTSHSSGQPTAWKASPAQQETDIAWTPAAEKSMHLPEEGKMFPTLNNYVESFITTTDSKDQLSDPAINLQLENTLKELIQEQQNNEPPSAITFGTAPPHNLRLSDPQSDLMVTNRNFQELKPTTEFRTGGYSFQPSTVKDALNTMSGEQFQTDQRETPTTMETPALHFPSTASLASNTNLVFTSSQKSMVSTSIQPSLESLPHSQAPVFPCLENQQKEVSRAEPETKDKSVLNEIMQFIQSSGHSIPKPEEKGGNGIVSPELDNTEKEIIKKIDDMQIREPLIKILNCGNNKPPQEAINAKTEEVRPSSPPRSATENANMLNCVNQVPPYPGILLPGQYMTMVDARGQVVMMNPMAITPHILHSQYMQAAKTVLSQENGRTESIPMFPAPMCPPQMAPFIGIPNPSMQMSAQLDPGASVTAAESQHSNVPENLHQTSMGGFQSPMHQGVNITGLPQMATLPHPSIPANMATGLQSVHLTGLPPANMGGLQPANLGGLQSANLGNMQSANLGGLQPLSLGSLQSANFGGLQSANMANLQSGNISPGLQSVNMTNLQSANLQPANVPSAVQSTNVSSGLQSTNVTSGLQATNMVPGLQSTNMAPDLQPTNMAPGLQTTNMAPSLQTTNMAHGLQSTNMDPGLQSTNMVSVLQSTGMVPANMIPGLQSTSLPSGIQSTSVVPGLPSSNLGNLHSARLDELQSTASGTPPSSVNGLQSRPLSESQPGNFVGAHPRLAGISHLDSIPGLQSVRGLHATVSGNASLQQQSLFQERLHSSMSVEQSGATHHNVLHHSSVLVPHPRDKD